jgi:hypothetical protein
MTPIVFGILVLVGTAWAKKTDEPVEARVQKLDKLVNAQATRIQALEAALQSCSSKSKGKGAKCDPDLFDAALDAEPELRAFRAVEKARAAAKKQEQLEPIFQVSVSCDSRASPSLTGYEEMCWFERGAGVPMSCARPRPVAPHPCDHAPVPLQVGSPLTALAISTNILDKGVPRVVAAADASGTLHLYDREGELSLTQAPTEQSSAARVSSIVIGAREDPFIATATSGGEVSRCAPADEHCDGVRLRDPRRQPAAQIRGTACPTPYRCMCTI